MRKIHSMAMSIDCSSRMEEVVIGIVKVKQVYIIHTNNEILKMIERINVCELSSVFESMWGGYKKVDVRLMKAESDVNRWHKAQMTVCAYRGRIVSKWH